MSIFKRRSAAVEHQYVPLRINGWYEMRLFDPRTSKADLGLGMTWVQRINNFPEDQWKMALGQAR